MALTVCSIDEAPASCAGSCCIQRLRYPRPDRLPDRSCHPGRTPSSRHRARTAVKSNADKCVNVGTIRGRPGERGLDAAATAKRRCALPPASMHSPPHGRIVSLPSSSHAPLPRVRASGCVPTTSARPSQRSRKAGTSICSSPRPRNAATFSAKLAQNVGRQPFYLGDLQPSCVPG